MDHTFSIVTRDALWRDGAMIEERLSSGIAEQRGNRITATDALDASLARVCDARFDEIRRAVPSTGRVRAVAFARRVSSIHGDDEFSSAALTITTGGASIVTTPDHLAADMEGERASRPQSPVDPPGDVNLPLVWRNGSASVLLHEAIGPAAEEGAPPLRWPDWLHVRDEPQFRLDDAGRIARTSDLLHDPPAAFRRATFKDVAIRRMTRVVVDAGAPFEMPDVYLEVHLASGGVYDPLTDEVAVTIARAFRVEDRRRESLRPFVIRASREHVRAALRGANGVLARYPGVVCSTDGQKLIVECFAPEMLTSELL